MKNHIASIFIIFFAFFGISVNVLAQDYKCPDNAPMRDTSVMSVSMALEDAAHVMKVYTGHNTPDEAQLYCDRMIKEKTARVDELHIEDYDSALTKIKREIDEARVLFKQQTESCNDCIASKLEAYEKKFIKKHGDHRYDTKGYRTKVVVVWGQAERIPTDKQAKYDLLYDEYMSSYDSSNDKQACPACIEAGETEAKIISLKHKMSEFIERHNNEIRAQSDLKDAISRCNDVSKSIEKYNTRLNIVAFLKTCKYPEESEATSTNTNTENHQNVNINKVQKTNEAINKARSVGRIFGF